MPVAFRALPDSPALRPSPVGRAAALPLPLFSPADTADLWSLVTKKLKEYNTASQVQNCLAGGAFIDRPDASGKYMVEHCTEQEKRNRQANLTGEANRCQRVAELLQQKASELLLDAVGKGDLTRVQLRTCAKAMTTSRTSTRACESKESFEGMINADSWLH